MARLHCVRRSHGSSRSVRKDLFRYFAQILEAVELPFVIQDFNPGGVTMSSRFVASLNSAFPHFRYIKLEEPMMSSRVREINDATDGRVGVLEGWGGMYMLELIPAGIAGVMPGLAVSDVLSLSFHDLFGYNIRGAGLHEAQLRMLVNVFEQGLQAGRVRIDFRIDFVCQRRRDGCCLFRFVQLVDQHDCWTRRHEQSADNSTKETQLAARNR